MTQRIGLVAAACLLVLPASCNLPPKVWEPWDAADEADADADLEPDAEAGLEDAEVDGDADLDEADADLEPDAEVVDLCARVFCFPDEVCDPATGECWSEGLDCGELIECWFEAGMSIGEVLPCLLEGSAEGRRDFAALVGCLVQGCLAELLNATADPMSLGICAFGQCPTELRPCAGGFF